MRIFSRNTINYNTQILKNNVFRINQHISQYNQNNNETK